MTTLNKIRQAYELLEAATKDDALSDKAHDAIIESLSAVDDALALATPCFEDSYGNVIDLDAAARRNMIEAYGNDLAKEARHG
ncbi:hypothetical protein [Sphingorhabdus sp. SMR4y]|uniref:hypothetical protein n=1 Tax=Sphingorhabdus sp. SMR4y TaxID=2584094 RepID=UPI000B5C9EA0|nr:hypothetical protein [Sphingorhabdus sp. SMR4y]ASK88495.1 hypothetical protein SPHFLASMR4Y_01748 [Sphingorhabdus sp. SMR4y]